MDRVQADKLLESIHRSLEAIGGRAALTGWADNARQLWEKRASYPNLVTSQKLAFETHAHNCRQIPAALDHLEILLGSLNIQDPLESPRGIKPAANFASDFAGKVLSSIVPVLSSKSDKQQWGVALNEIRRSAEELLALGREHEEDRRLSGGTVDHPFDPTLPAPKPLRGSLHPVTRVQRDLEDLFTSMGWLVLDGPEVELEHYNFDALNIPPDHPARDTMDTFRCDAEGKLVLRTHTSPGQVRAMERLKPPFRAIVPGKVFRNETKDASHEHTFHQMEGLAVDRDLSVGHLIGTMKTLLRSVFGGRDIEIRLRPGYFPFVEPGFELDARCPFCKSGCSVCKQSTWIEILPCGMVHPNVLKAGGIDPERWTGFAFGLGLSRLAMLRYGIDDVRLLLSGDLRFLEQFA